MLLKKHPSPADIEFFKGRVDYVDSDLKNVAE